MDDIQSKVKEFLSRLLWGDHYQHDLQPDERISTLGFWQEGRFPILIIDWVEKEFGVKVEDEDLESSTGENADNFDSIRAISDFIARKQAASRQ